jgi:thiol-disulfide isomerase/thioredoxin
MKRLLCLVALLVLGVAVFAQDLDPVKTVREISNYRAQKIKAAREAKQAIDAEALNKECVAMARDALKKANLDKIDASKAMEWARLALVAEEDRTVVTLCKQFVASNPEPKQKFSAQSMMLSALANLGDGDSLASILPTIIPDSKMTAATLASMTASTFLMPVEDKKGPAEALDLLNAIEKKVPFDEFKTDAEKLLADDARISIADAKSHLYLDLGRRNESLKTIDDAMKVVSESSPGFRRLKAAKAQVEMLGGMPPAIPVERVIGQFKDLDSLKGKVVIVSFFAHWCGSCMQSYPDVVKLYSDLHGKGLEIVGVTAYYGFYKNEGYEKRDMAKDIEFGHLGEFAKEHGITWPIVYTEKSNYTPYGVVSIPHFVVINKKGQVVKIKVDYSESGFKEFRKTIERLLKD